jgi:hypothetical protein
MVAALTLGFSESKPPFLQDVSNLLFDLELAYDFGVILTEPEYSQYKFGRYFWYRNKWRLYEKHRLQAVEIELHSPLFLKLVAPSLAGLAGLLQIIQMVSNWSLNREKLELEVSKLRREEAAHRAAVAHQYSQQLRELTYSRDAEGFDDKIAKKLSLSNLRLAQLELQLEDVHPPSSRML